MPNPIVKKAVKTAVKTAVKAKKPFQHPGHKTPKGITYAGGPAHFFDTRVSRERPIKALNVAGVAVKTGAVAAGAGYAGKKGYETINNIFNKPKPETKEKKSTTTNTTTPSKKTTGATSKYKKGGATKAKKK